MVIVLVLCTLLFSLLAEVVATYRCFDMKKILISKRFYLLTAVNIILSVAIFSAVYTDFFALFGEITLKKFFVYLAVSATVTLSISLLSFHKRLDGARKIAVGLIVCLVLTLFAELFVYNSRAIESAEYRRISVLAGGEILGGQENGDGSYTLDRKGGNLIFELKGFGSEVRNIYVDAEGYTKDGEPLDLTLKIEATDKANELYITSMPKRTLYYGVSELSYIPMQLRGATENMRITLTATDCTNIVIKDISVNAPRPFSVSGTRMALTLALMLAVYLLRPSSPVYKIKLGRSRGQTVFTAAVIIAELLLVFSLIASTDHFTKLISAHHGQYQQLARSFQNGHLYLETEVPDFLLEMENPYDYALRTAQRKYYYWDAALYGGHYYVYFGVVPCLLLYLPFNLLTGYDLPNDIAIFIFAILFVIGCFTLVRQIIKRYFPDKNVSYIVYILLSLLIVNTSGLLYIASYADMYSVPIMGALAFTVIGLSFWLSALSNKRFRALKLATGSLSMALVAGCRPNILLFSFLFFPLFFGEIIKAFKEKRAFSRESVVNAVAFALPYIVVAAGIMWYNYARFDSPFDFGANYNLTTNDMTSRGFVWERMGVAAFMYLFQLPKLISTFPFIRNCDFDSTYMGVTIRETMYGGIFAYSPFLWLMFLVPRVKEKLKKYKLLIPAVMLFAFGIITPLLDAQFAGILQRYFADFSLMLWLGALLVFLPILVDTDTDRRRKDLRTVLLVCVAVSFAYQTLLVLRSANVGEYISFLFWY